MIWLIPVLLIAFGVWRFYTLSSMGVPEAWLGLFVLLTCIILAFIFIAGALSCAVFC